MFYQQSVHKKLGLNSVTWTVKNHLSTKGCTNSKIYLFLKKWSTAPLVSYKQIAKKKKPVS